MTILSTYDFSTLYTRLPHTLIKERLLNMIEHAYKKLYKRMYALSCYCNDKIAFFTSADHRGYKFLSCQIVCVAISYLLGNTNIRFGNKLYRQIFGDSMGTDCAPLVADLRLFYYERDFMTSLSNDNQADIIESFNSTSRYLDNLFDIENPYFEGMINQIYPPKLQLNKAYTSETETPFLDFHLSISNGFVSSKIYDKHDKFTFLDDDIPCQPIYGVYISQLKRFAKVFSHVEDFMLVINALLLNFSNMMIGIISLERLFPRSIAATINLFQNSMSD